MAHQVIGASNTGKSVLLEILIRQSIAQGRPVIVIDPEGCLVEKIRSQLPLYVYEFQNFTPDPEREG